MKTWFLFGMVVVAGATLLSGCSGVDRALGRSKTSPDEFQVVVRPPLTLPPNFSLRPDDLNPDSGGETGDTGAEPTRNDAVSLADQVLTGAAKTQTTGFESLFDFAAIEPDIRIKVDEETAGIQLERRLPIQTLFGGQPNVGPNLVSGSEALRIRRARLAGDNLTATPTLAVDPVDNTQIAVE